MKALLALVLLCVPLLTIAQNTFDNEINSAAKMIAAKADDFTGSNKRVAILNFYEVDGSLTYLGRFLSDEIASGLVDESDNGKKFEVISADRITKIIDEKRLPGADNPSQTAVGVGDLGGTSILVFGIISDFGSTYRLSLKLYSTQTGNEFAAVKVSFEKSNTLDSYHNRKVSTMSGTTSLNEKKPGELVMPVSSPNSSTGVNNQQTVNQVQPRPTNCATGDFCFINTSKWKKTVDVLGAQRPLGRDVLYTITIQPGDTGCLYDIPAGPHDISIRTYYEDPNSNGVYSTPIISRPEERQIRVERCATEKDIKPLRLR
ncbi:MAG TPA: hypothetical protein VHS53_10685 [Mucilaginibacter sp.]|jgi:hypothetical protein|nr:hypothetical protein [Mucilaginibacter sp.]